MERVASLSFRVGLLLMLGASIYWLSQYQPAKKQKFENLSKTTLDEFMLGVNAKRFSQNGQLKQQLKMQKWQHYLGAPSSQFEQPKLTLFRPDKTHWQLTAQQGEGEHTSLGGNLENVILQNNVLFKQQTFDLKETTQNWELQTNQLILHPKTEIAETQEDVLLKGPNVNITSKGATATLPTGQIEFTNKVQSHYVVSNNNR